MTELSRSELWCRLFLLAGLLCFALLAQGCVAVAGGGAAVAGTTVAQDRSVGEAVSDENLNLSIRRELDKVDLDHLVDVSVIDGHVVLTGTVYTQDQRIDAAKAAWAFKNVKDVDNEVQIGNPGGPIRFAKDAWITTRVRTTLWGDKKVKGVNYDVETVRGVVYLMGTARSRQELEDAVEKVRRIGGVKKVVSLVRIRPPKEQKTASN
jgi:osmotically-inducible protein OsmY